MSHISVTDAAFLVGVSKATIHKWAREGRVTRYYDGFDPWELKEAADARDPAALLSRDGIRFEDRHAG